MDSEEAERAYEESRKKRTVNLSQLTKLYNELETKMISRDNVKTVKILFTKLCDRYEHFKAAHLECLDFCTNSDIIETLEINFDSSQKNFIEFRERYNEWIREPEKAKEEEDKNSRITSVSRTSSSTQYRLKLARANRLKAEVQKKMAEKQELERARREIEMKEQMLERKSQLEEAKLEESVWQEEEEDTESTENAVSRIECTTAGSLQSNSSIDTAFQRLASTLQEGFNLPKPELLTFDGKPTDYCKFIKNFETNVECRVTDDQLKLSYLIQYCKGEAKSSIEDCVLLEKKGYERARSILHSRYGRSHMIVRSYIENLVYGAPIKASDFESLSKLALEMQKCEITLSQLGYVSDIDNTDNLRKIVKRLPMHLRVKWVDIAHSITENGREPRFSDLANFIDKKSRLASSMFGLDLVRENSNTYRKDIDKHTDMNTREKVSTFASNNMYVSKATTQDRKCIYCNGTCTNLELCVKIQVYEFNR
ncbi:thioredoxin domain-containing protein 10 [Mytilus galloprovincialis]|uniref:Thioredoxin domain-containing protein 10 n=1 Tax=Mytilus galloprovincialis TaxID=29158 RepID=A0A8B6GMW6_MYTGA|nr:thioredoxin domain-containing protein 10 [Mytilus galloprovincialis]